jgi:hypothetical protein
MKGKLLGFDKRAVLALFVIVVAFALFSTSWTLTYGRPFRRPSGDGVGYETMARQLLQRGVYGYKSTRPNAYVTPGYPLFLAGVYKLTGHAQSGRPRLPLQGIQILFSCGTILLTFLIGAWLTDEYAGLIGASLMALYPPMIVVTNLWLTEALATFALMSFVAVSLLALRRQRLLLWAASGALLAVAVLVRPTVLPIGVIPVVMMAVERKPWRQTARAAVLMGITWACVMSPWVVRNLVSLHEPAVLSSHSGDPMLAGVDPYYYELGPGYRFHGPTYKRYMRLRPSGVTKDAYAVAAVTRYVETEPIRYLGWLTFGKAFHMYFTGWLDGLGGQATWAQLIRTFIVTLGLVGMIFAFKDRRLLIAALMVILGTATLLPFVPEPRFAFSLLPLLSILAAAVVRLLWVGKIEPRGVRPA